METNELESVTLAFLEEWEDGKNPTLQAYVARHPQLALPLTDFVLDLIDLEASLKALPDDLPLSPWEGSSVQKALRSFLAGEVK